MNYDVDRELFNLTAEYVPLKNTKIRQTRAFIYKFREHVALFTYVGLLFGRTVEQNGGFRVKKFFWKILHKIDREFFD